jgi:aryl-alcohol dehydrogenase-like predicted oxidoreductase
LHQEGVTAAIAGSSNPQHVLQNAQAAALDLPADVLADLERQIALGPTVADTT